MSEKALREEVVLQKIKFSSSRDKYGVLRVRWYEYVREALKGREARKLVHGSCKVGDIVRSMVVGHRS